MRWWDIVVLVVNIIFAIASGFGAYNSIRYFKKSKHITIYAQSNQAFNDVGEMLKISTEALAAASTVKKGYSPENTVRGLGCEMSEHLNAVMKAIPSDYSEHFRGLQRKNTFEVEGYINSLIDGSAVVEVSGRKTLERTSFDACQESLREMQEFLRKKIAEEEEKLK